MMMMMMMTAAAATLAVSSTLLLNIVSKHHFFALPKTECGNNIYVSGVIASSTCSVTIIIRIG